MQFHYNGFTPGDPTTARIGNPEDTRPRRDPLPEECDVLIVGCGPAGLTLAAQLAAFADIKTCIIEQKDDRITLGQADGIACRTVEMFEAFDFAERVLKEACWINETSFWRPDPETPDHIYRSGRIQDTEDGLSEFPHVVLNQARVHDFYLDVMRNGPGHIVPYYSRRLLDLEVDPNAGTGARASSHPVTARIERSDAGHEGDVETIRARYVVGCDGARSVVRHEIGRKLVGDSANQAWGVMDVLAVSDFPDFRMKAAIHSANEGNAILIPREGGFLVRLYIELDKLNENERVANKNITVDHIIAAAQRIFRPYSLEVKEVPWWSVYEIGQRLCDKFDDVPEDQIATRLPHVFITGDACHTHSPKAGQGMNVSMGDGFNLGWKLAAVLQGRSAPELLHSYSGERQTIAKQLIDFDRELARMFSARPKTGPDDTEGVDPAEFQKYFVQHGRFTAGTAIHYAASDICGGHDNQHLAAGLTTGMRFHSAPVIRLADAKPIHLGHTVKADGRWRVFAFAASDDQGGPDGKIAQLCDWLENGTDSPIRRATPKGADLDSVIDLRVVFQKYHRDLRLDKMPALLLPTKGRHALRDYEKIYCPDLNPGQDIFDMRGIDRARGCMVVVRPDQYVANILPLDDNAGLAAFFQRIMLPAM
ncbi:FAD-binding monooxygenase [Alkalilacustris brevis]|uniref:FAD-binding monooxygenase n=1 Tax=Alkalilacustris brevis TaxID=2026338 RepID=UPI000E0DA5AA|nr:FAD-binding monooxygenase [Alkalilacustris brevis]